MYYLISPNCWTPWRTHWWWTWSSYSITQPRSVAQAVYLAYPLAAKLPYFAAGHLAEWHIILHLSPFSIISCLNYLNQFCASTKDLVVYLRYVHAHKLFTFFENTETNKQINKLGMQIKHRVQYVKIVLESYCNFLSQHLPQPASFPTRWN